MAIVFIGYGGFTFFFIKDGQGSYQGEGISQGAEKILQKSIFLPQAGSFDAYSKVIESRDLFKAVYPRELRLGGKKAEEAPDLNFEENFKVVGIVLDHDPKAILEDLSNKETLFLSEGEQAGGAVLEKIEKGKVIFLYEDKLIEIVP